MLALASLNLWISSNGSSSSLKTVLAFHLSFFGVYIRIFACLIYVFLLKLFSLSYIFLGSICMVALKAHCSILPIETLGELKPKSHSRDWLWWSVFTKQCLLAELMTCIHRDSVFTESTCSILIINLIVWAIG